MTTTTTGCLEHVMTPKDEQAVEDAVADCRAAMTDLRLDLKLVALERITGWIELERKSYLPETKANN
jgi:hypothetical protein